MSGLTESLRTSSRKRGTRLRELRDLYESGISARAVYEPLECRRPEDPAGQVAAYMEKNSYDVIGVRPEDRPPIGFVTCESLNSGPCRDYLERFASEYLIADSTPLVTVLSTLRDRPYVFVLTREKVSAIITRADLQKPAVRMYLFGLVTLFEMQMGALIRWHYDEDEWHQELSPNRLDGAREFQEERKKRNEELALLDCLQFCDKRDLILTRKAPREVLGIPSKTQGRKLLRSAEALRDNLAHAQELAMSGGWPETIDLVLEIETMIERSEEFFSSDS